ncbi:transposase [Aeromonas media]|uniref:Transposase n=1 Tax=Aeromonas media TaxID=651 RepID=A0AAE7AHV0_AERME|nr:transposase [Aeromonas media]
MKSREHYSPEFRAEAVRLVLEQGLGQAEAARRLGIAKGTLSNWVVAAKGGKDTSAIPGARSVAELEAQVARLRKALAQANMERDIIKKAAVDSIGQRNNHVKTCSCGGLLNETNIYSKGKSVCF